MYPVDDKFAKILSLAVIIYEYYFIILLWLLSSSSVDKATLF